MGTRWNGKLVFSTNGKGHSCHMRKDGNLVIWNKQKRLIWSTMTSGHANAYLALQNDGDLGIYSKEGNVKLWSSNTAFNTCDSRDTFSCNRRREEYVAALHSSSDARKTSSRPVLGDGQKLVTSLRRRLRVPHLREAMQLFNEFRFVEGWDMFAFKETWTDIDTEELRLLDGGENIFVKGALTTEAFADRLPSINDLAYLLAQRDVAIVGNGRTLRGHGREIDNHSVIVRFNHLVAGALGRVDTGLRTHVHVVNAKIRKDAGPGVLLFDLEGKYTWRSYCRRYSWDKDLKKTYLVRPSARCAFPRFESWTRGFVFYWLLGSLFEQVDLYGMSEADGSYHYKSKFGMLELFTHFEHALYSEAEKLIIAAHNSHPPNNTR